MFLIRVLAWCVALSLPGIAPAGAQPAQLACPDDMIARRGDAAPLDCTCRSDQLIDGTVWGTDTYTDDSRICRAALHGGAIGQAGGVIRVTPAPGLAAYVGTTRNGVQSEDYGTFEYSYRVERLGAAEAAATDDACPQYGHALRGTDQPMTCRCSAEDAAAERPVWGSTVYTDDSAICPAAVHAGAIGREGGQVTVIPAPGRDRYIASMRNGIRSQDFATWLGSFRFEGVETGGIEACPDNFAAYRTGGPLTCRCDAAQIASGTVWGWGVYTDDSGVCRAARHAGAIEEAGGEVTVEPLPGQRAYLTGLNNGVTSQAYGPWPASFRFAGVTMPPAPPQPVDALLCPDDFTAYRGEGQPVACLCPAEATLGGTVAGTDVYADGSSLCRAALHAGAVGRLGGAVLVSALPGAQAYRGSDRNGVTSLNGGPAQGSFRVQPARPEGARSATSLPIQAPVQETLQRTGRVQLYVNFRTGSADLDAAAIALLQDLRAALVADATMRLRLVGHTDSTGNAAANIALSLRRADSVRAWLVGQGIVPARLETAGAGMEQPIADNLTEPGRALNRRVMAERLR